MSSCVLKVEMVVRQIETDPRRSSLFHWLCEHHDELLAAAKDGRIVWGPICVAFAEGGLVNGNGKSITPDRATKTWTEVRREIARRRGLKKPKTEQERVRAPADWQPAIVVRGNQAHLPSQPPVAVPADAGSGQRTEGKASLLTKPKSEAQLIADIAMTKHPQDRTPEEKLAVNKAERERRSYSS